MQKLLYASSELGHNSLMNVGYDCNIQCDSVEFNKVMKL